MEQTRIYLLVSFAITSFFSLHAQYNKVLNASNFGGVTNVNYNPAIADNRLKFDMNLITFGMNIENNYIGISNKPILDRKLFDVSGFESLYLKEKLNGRPKSALIHFDAQLPLSFMVSWGKNRSNKNALAITSNFNSLTNVDNVSEILARSSYYGLGFKADSLTGFNFKELTEKNLAIRNMEWLDVGATYSRVVYDKGVHFVKVGGTLKLLMGVASAYLYSDNARYRFNNFDSLDIYDSDVRYGHSDNLSGLTSGEFSFNKVSDALKNSRISAAADIGAVYEWRPNKDDHKYTMDCQEWWKRERDRYKLAVGFSVIDIGAIRFNKSENDRNFRADIRNWEVKKEPWGPVENNDSIIKNKFGNSDDKSTFTVWLPTRFNIFLDYHIWKGFGLNLNTTISPVMAKERNQMRLPTSVTLTPKYDYKWAGVYVPISYDDFGNFSAGAGLRLGPLFVSSQNIITLAAKKWSYNVNIQAGLKITIPNSLHRDRDKDGVSNKKDKCKKEKGTCETGGCSDKDNDGITDNLDLCPDQAGPLYTAGCPDRDGDSIPDMNDSCPDVFGSRVFFGCPDTDGDGIVDKDDACPTEAGTKELNGCPDRDGDGVADKDDACPDVPGDKSHAGCPDSDGDGIYDNFDKCPREKGVAENNGCPWPDTDGDGVLDKDDACPKVFGVKENKGCPVLDKKEVATLNYAFKNLEFETGKDVIRTSSYASLNGLAKLLVEKGYGLKTEGHTDSQGDDAKNMDLSMRRANAVKAYLISKGVNGSKLSTAGFGETQPIADNKTAEGRQRNRRVVMTIDFN
jgi:outer membrane protein OmpA-like peptidoglycan-associated protein